MKFGKKASDVDPFSFAGSLGYYILVMMIISVLLLFLNILLSGSQLNYYKNDFGARVINIDETILNYFEYSDPITSQSYSKILSLEKIYQSSDSILDDILGISDVYTLRGARIEFYLDDSKYVTFFETMTYVEEQVDSYNTYPVLFAEGDTFKIGKVIIYHYTL